MESRMGVGTANIDAVLSQFLKFNIRHGSLLIEAYSQYTKHHSDLLTLKSLNFLPYDFGRIWAYIF